MVDDVGRGTSPQILGRSRELDRIDEMVERLGAGRGGVVVLIGPPGIGLTTLLEETIERAGVAVADVRAVHVPSGLLEGDATGVQGMVAALAADESFRSAAEAVTEALRDTRGTITPDDPRLVQVAIAALRTLSGERPLLVTVDNLPVDDPAVFNALASLAAGVAVMPVLVVVTSHLLPRSSFEESPVGPLWVRRVPPLGTADAVTLVRAAADRWVPHSVASAVAQSTGGVPGDLVAVCRALDADQLTGTEPLPETLPGTPVTTATYREWWLGLDAQERLLLLALAGGVSPDRTALEDCAGLAITDVAGPDGDAVLGEKEGSVYSRDARLLSAVRALATPRDVREALTALAASYPDDSLGRQWNAVRAGRPVTPEMLDTLVEGARELLDRGDVAAVQALVTDFVEQRPAPAVRAVELLLIGGVAAVYGGHPARAVTLLTAALAEAPDDLARIAPLLIIATTHRDRAVPHRLVGSCLQRLGDVTSSASVAALAARLCAEHGDVGSATGYLDRMQLSEDRDDGREFDAELALTRAMVEGGRPAGRESDPLEVLGVRRPGTDVVGWLLELQQLRQLVDSGDWTLARGEIADLAARLKRFPAPLLRAELALASVRLYLATSEYRRADDVAAAAVRQMLPLHVPRGGAGVALLAQVALLRGRAAEAEHWLTDVAELVQRSPGSPVVTAALHETLGLHARLGGDLTAAADHYARAVHEDGVTTSTLIDLAHLRWRTARTGDEEAVAVLRAQDGVPALTAAATLLRAPVDSLVETVTSVAESTRGSLTPVHEAQLLEIAADRVGASVAGPGGGPAVPPDYRLTLLRRARDLYSRSGAEGLADAVAREIARVERDFAPTNAALATLSADELTIARLVHQGATNKEVAGALYLSVRTVELRLTGIYRKLGISSRRELRQLTGLAGPVGGSG